MTVQEKVKRLCDEAEECSKLPRWVKGHIPKHYKRLSIEMDEAIEIAKIGAKESMLCYKTPLFFTQSLLFGAVVQGKYKTIVVVTPSQYGKSWTCGEIIFWLGFHGHDVRVAGGDDGTTEIIMNKILGHIPNAHPEMKKKLLETPDKIDKLQSSLSKRKLTFKGSGLIEAISLGESTNDPLKHNKAVGRGGDIFLDEAALCSDDAMAEIGRREFSNVNGEKDLLFMISNPHKVGTFYDYLTDENPAEDTLIVWMDVRTSLEEGRIPSVERVLNSQFFKNDSTCQRYFLCELEDYSDKSMFQNMKLIDLGQNYIDRLSQERCTFFLGVDAAYKGKDKIKVCLTSLNSHGEVYVLDIADISKGEWVDGVTSVKIVADILKIIRQFRVKYVSVDIGFGVYILEELAKYADKYEFIVRGVNFGGGTDKKRAKNGHYSAKYGANMRSEMHLDLQELMDYGKVWFTVGVAKVLKPQMAAVRTLKTRNGKTGIISKDLIKAKIGHSPDDLDSCLLSIHSLMCYNIGSGLDYYNQLEDRKERDEQASA